MKNNFIVALLALVVFSADAQQEMQFVSAFHNPYIYNPAAGGIADVAQIDLVTRLQWTGMGPTSINLNGHSVLGISNSAKIGDYNVDKKPLFAKPTMNVGSLKHVVGGKFVSDQIGVFSRMSAYGSYAVHMPLTSEFNVGVGLGLGWSNFKINQNKVILHDKTDDVYANALVNASQQNNFDANAGITLYGKGLFVGASVSQVFNNKAKFNGLETNSKYNTHYFFQVSYGVKISESTLEPAVIVKNTWHSPASLDFGARYIHRNATWLGVYGRTGNSMIFQLGSTLIENLYINYSFEIGTGVLRNNLSNTHEIQLGIYLGKRKAKKNVTENEGE